MQGSCAHSGQADGTVDPSRIESMVGVLRRFKKEPRLYSTAAIVLIVTQVAFFVLKVYLPPGTLSGAQRSGQQPMHVSSGAASGQTIVHVEDSASGGGSTGPGAESTGPTAATLPAPIRITRPTEGGYVDQYDDVEGDVRDGGDKVWLIVQSRNACWLQGPAFNYGERAQKGTGTTFSISAQFGQANSSGERYTVRAVTNPPTGVQPGEIPCGLRVAAVSEPVHVMRR